MLYLVLNLIIWYSLQHRCDNILEIFLDGTVGNVGAERVKQSVARNMGFPHFV